MRQYQTKLQSVRPNTLLLSIVLGWANVASASLSAAIANTDFDDKSFKEGVFASAQSKLVSTTEQSADAFSIVTLDIFSKTNDYASLPKVGVEVPLSLLTCRVKMTRDRSDSEPSIKKDGLACLTGDATRNRVPFDIAKNGSILDKELPDKMMSSGSKILSQFIGASLAAEEFADLYRHKSTNDN